MPLKASEIRQISGRDRPYRMADSKGLYLLVKPSGQRLWRLDYRFFGKYRTMAFGIYPEVSLAEARERRDAARKLLADGKDPMDVARDEKRAARLAAELNFRFIAEEWLGKVEREGKNSVTIGKHRWLLAQAYPTLGPRQISKITTYDVYQVLKAVEARGHYETARRLRGICGRVIRYAVATGRAERDVTVELRGALITPVVKHLAAITKPDEAGALMWAIEGFDGYRVTHVALRLIPHVFVRPGELRHAEWAEFDFEEGIWTIPAEKMKMRRPHCVPLSRQALQIIEDVRPISGGHKFLFPAKGKRDRPMCENTLNLALQRLGFGGDRMTAHGFRSMASTLLNELGVWNPDAIERQLAHVDANAVRRIYSRGEYWDERVRMMQAWSDYLDGLRAAARDREQNIPKLSL